MDSLYLMDSIPSSMHLFRMVLNAKHEFLVPRPSGAVPIILSMELQYTRNAPSAAAALPLLQLIVKSFV